MDGLNFDLLAPTMTKMPTSKTGPCWGPKAGPEVNERAIEVSERAIEVSERASGAGANKRANAGVSARCGAGLLALNSSVRPPAVPEGAGHVDLLADLLHRLLEERERVLRDGLLLLCGLLALAHNIVAGLCAGCPVRREPTCLYRTSSV